MVLRRSRSVRAIALIAALGLMAGAEAMAGPENSGVKASRAAGTAEFKVPVEYYKLGNGLRVVLSPDHTAPTVCVAVYYHIGFRIEPRDRTGFAHLFEHMMFQGSQNLGKMEHVKLVQQNGGVLNGSTRFDFTNYFEIMPANKLETVLWAEADRMSGLQVTEENLKNQQGVVGNEVKVNVLNQPYGGFPWLDMPQYANTNWYNAHNFYGDLKDIEAAKLEEVQGFFKTYYAPNNAALAVTGDFEPAQAKQWIEKYFAGIKRADVPAVPELTEPRQEKEKRANKLDAKAQRPALAVAYHMPERNTPEFYAMGLLANMLLRGDDSLLRQELVQKRGFAGGVGGGINLLGNNWNYQGPMLFIASLIHDPATNPEAILQAMDGVIEPLRSKPVDQKTLDRALVKLQSSFYENIGNGFGLADLLASLALFDDNPAHVNELMGEYKKVTPQLIQKTAQEYLRSENRTILTIQPQAPAPAAAAAPKN
jgi:zinc protease